MSTTGASNSNPNRKACLHEEMCLFPQYAAEGFTTGWGQNLLEKSVDNRKKKFIMITNYFWMALAEGPGEGFL